MTDRQARGDAPRRGLTAAESWRIWDEKGRLRRPMPDRLQPFREHGSVSLAPCERFYTWNLGPLRWRLIAINERMEAEVAGPEFESKTEALLALPALARAHGCVRSR